jgi:AcrR family transcriptional regulator
VSLSNHRVLGRPSRIITAVPKLWTETIETHRREVREAILDTTATLVAEHGLLGVTMSQIAEETGIGRATLYKYFPDVEAILLAWHDRQIAAHLAQLSEIRDQGGDAGERLEAVLETYALLSSHSRGHQSAGVTELMHRTDQLGRAQRQVHELIRGLLIEAAKSGDVRHDVPADELADFCVEALKAARHRSRAAIRRLVTVTLAGLRPPAS